MKIKRFFWELLKLIIVFLLFEIPVVLIGIIIYPRSPDDAIKMQVTGDAISLYNPDKGHYGESKSRRFLINGEKFTGLEMLKIRPISKAIDMIRQEDKVDIQYFMVGESKCIVDMRGDSTVYADYTKEYAGKKIVSIVMMVLTQFVVGLLQYCFPCEAYCTLKYGDWR